MNRREFLQALSALGVTYLPAETLAGMLTGQSLPSQQNDTVLADQLSEESLNCAIIAIGGAACCILPKLAGLLPRQIFSQARTVAIDTSARALWHAGARRQILLHIDGHRPGSPQAAACLAQAERAAIEQSLLGMHLVFILAGMGGVAGSSIAPVVANIAREAGITTVVAAVMPFEWEGTVRNGIANDACGAMLEEGAHALFLLNNDEFARACGDDAPMQSVLDLAPEQFAMLYRSIVMPVAVPGLIGVDFEDMRYGLSHPGLTFGGDATASGCDVALKACAAAIAQPWLGAQRLRAASAVMVNIEFSGEEFSLKMYCDIARFIRAQCHAIAFLLFSATPIEMPGIPLRISILASGVPG